jgi:hypothetical protein
MLRGEGLIVKDGRSYPREQKLGLAIGARGRGRAILKATLRATFWATFWTTFWTTLRTTFWATLPPPLRPCPTCAPARPNARALRLRGNWRYTLLQSFSPRPAKKACSIGLASLYELNRWGVPIGQHKEPYHE